MRTQKNSKLLKPEIVLKQLEKILKESQEYKKKRKFWDAQAPHVKADYMLLDLIESLTENKNLVKEIRKTFSKIPFWYA